MASVQGRNGPGTLALVHGKNPALIRAPLGEAKQRRRSLWTHRIDQVATDDSPLVPFDPLWPLMLL